MVVGGLACAGGAIMLALGLGNAARAITHAIAAACDQRVTLQFAGDRMRDAQALQPATVPLAVLALATPLLGMACAALLGHLAQTRAFWLPRRRIAGAPAVPRGPGPRTRTAAFELVCTAAIGAAAFGWLWKAAPRLATLVALNASDMLTAAAALGAAVVAVLAAGWLILGVVDSLTRHLELAHALAMTSAEKREDDRLAAADPRWAQHRAALSRAPTAEPAVRDAAVVLIGDAFAIAIAWDPLRRPIPTCAASGRGARASQLVGLARRHGVAIHRDPGLVAALGDGLGPVPEAEWARLADVIAAVRR